MAKNKRGSIQDIAYFIGIVLTISILFLFGYKIMSSVNDGFQASDQINDDGKDSFNRMTNLYPGVMDNSVLLIVAILMIGTLGLAALIRVHPIFIIFFVIFLLALVIVSAICANVYIGIASADGMTQFADNMPIMTFVICYLPWIIAIFGIILAIIMYKNYSENQLG